MTDAPEREVMKVGGPMFESSETRYWQSIRRKQGAHYNTYAAVDEEVRAMAALRELFPDGEANEMNLCMFSTSGVHGMYTTIEEVERWVLHGEKDDIWDEEGGPEAVTFLVVQPRIVCTRYGNCVPKTPEDFAFLKKLRASSWAAFQQIGAPAPPEEK